MYLQHRGSQQGTNKAKNILFYALWVLYALSAATGIIDLLQFWPDTVSMDDRCCLTLFQLLAVLLYRTSRYNTTLTLSNTQYLLAVTSLPNLS